MHEPTEREDFHGTPEDEHRVSLGPEVREPCPTCGGTSGATFDASCANADRHGFLSLARPTGGTS
jgi:hypothetical protein